MKEYDTEDKSKLKRVKYNKSSLRNVVFQVRFPTNLRIATNLPDVSR